MAQGIYLKFQKRIAIGYFLGFFPVLVAENQRKYLKIDFIHLCRILNILE